MSQQDCKHLDRSGHTFRGRYDKFGYKFCPKCGIPLSEITDPYPTDYVS